MIFGHPIFAKNMKEKTKVMGGHGCPPSGSVGIWIAMDCPKLPCLALELTVAEGSSGLRPVLSHDLSGHHLSFIDHL